MLSPVLLDVVRACPCFCCSTKCTALSRLDLIVSTVEFAESLFLERSDSAAGLRKSEFEFQLPKTNLTAQPDSL